MAKIQTKICGINDPGALDAAARHGARFAGFVFYPASPRSIGVDTAALLTRRIPASMKSVGLFVDPVDDLLQAVTSKAHLDMIQLHGHEDPKRIQTIRTATGLPVIKAIRVATRDDLRDVAAYAAVADWLLFDAKVPESVSKLPGGTGHSFDWPILQGFKTNRPWMLSGGLHAGNVGEALSILRPDAVDVSSGVEDRPGVKNIAKIEAFLHAVLP